MVTSMVNRILRPKDLGENSFLEPPFSVKFTGGIDGQIFKDRWIDAFIANLIELLNTMDSKSHGSCSIYGPQLLKMIVFTVCSSLQEMF